VVVDDENPPAHVEMVARPAGTRLLGFPDLRASSGKSLRAPPAHLPTLSCHEHRSENQTQWGTRCERRKQMSTLGLAALTLMEAPGVAAGGPAAGAGADDTNAVHYYLSLGDSYAQGYQPIGGPPSPLGFPGYNQGYADQLLKLVRNRYDHLQLVKLGCGGETTTTMIAGTPWCGPKITPGSQLAQATAFLEAHRGEVAFVTIDIGGNDII